METEMVLEMEGLAEPLARGEEETILNELARNCLAVSEGNRKMTKGIDRAWCAQVLLSVFLMTSVLMAEARDINMGWPGGRLYCSSG